MIDPNDGSGRELAADALSARKWNPIGPVELGGETDIRPSHNRHEGIIMNRTLVLTAEPVALSLVALRLAVASIGQLRMGRRNSDSTTSGHACSLFGMILEPGP